MGGMILSADLCSFMPKYHCFPLRVCFILGPQVLLAFFVERGAAMIAASTIVPDFSSKRLARSATRDALEWSNERQTGPWSPNSFGR